MNTKPTLQRRLVGLALVVIGLGMVAYALSDDPLYGGEPGFGATQAAIAFAGILVSACAFTPFAVAQRTLLLAVTTIFTLAVTEVSGEWFLGPRHRPIYQFDDELIFKFIPNRSSATTLAAINGGETVMHRINSAGYRGAELRPTGSVPRVAVYGDSFIHAYYTQEDKTFCAQLAAMLAKASGREIEVVNAGVSSYGPDQIALKMQRELPQLRPDVVMVAVFAGNDYGDLLRNKIFRLSPTGELESIAWSLDPKIRVAFDMSQKESILKRAVRDLSAQWRRPPEPGAAGVPDFLLDQAEREYRSAVVAPDSVVTNTHADYYSADVSLLPESPSARYKVNLMRATLQRIKEIAARHQVPLVFLFIPHPFDATDDHEWGPVDKQRFPLYDMRNQVAPLEEAARALSTPALSLMDPFRAAGASTLYLRGGDDHWNALGQQTAAKAMADYLKGLGWLGLGSAPKP